MDFRQHRVGSWLLYVLLAAFFVSTLVLTVGVPDMYNSPDERANAFFVRQVVEESRFVAWESLNGLEGAEGVIVPRSIRAVGSMIVPASFIGLPFTYGLIGKVVGVFGAHLLTPILAVLAVLAWRRVLETVYTKRVALLGALLLLFLASFWFYTARVMMHNVPFLAFVIFGCYFLTFRPFSRRSSVHPPHHTHLPSVPMTWADVVLAGVCLGLALLFRSSAWFWLGIVGAVFWAFFPRALSWKQILLFLVSVAVFVSPYFLWNFAIFGSPITTGYTFESPQLVGTSLESPTSGLRLAIHFLFPFGFHPRAAWNHFLDYQVLLTWWMTILAALGLPLLFAGNRHDEHETRCSRAILLATFLAGGYLTFLYGSWNVADNPDPSAVTLANSYMRYWLPIFLASTIPAALGIDWMMRRARTEFISRALGVVLTVLAALFSFRLVFLHPDDGLVRTRAVLQESITLRDEIVALTEPHSVIVTDRADKILFPKRRVVVPLRNERTLDALPAIAEERPLYYFGITLPREDFEHLNTAMLSPRGLVAEPVEAFNEQTLYRMEIYE